MNAISCDWDRKGKSKAEKKRKQSRCFINENYAAKTKNYPKIEILLAYIFIIRDLIVANGFFLMPVSHSYHMAIGCFK